MPAHVDLSGRSFGKIRVLRVSHKDARHAYFYVCACFCGASFVAEGDKIKRRHTRSCGCLQESVKHGLVNSAEYGIWNAMKGRCLNPRSHAFRDYGGRGIKVCKRWLDFRNFYADMGPRPTPSHSLDRKDNDGNYEPGNVRWATKSEQAKNRRNNKKSKPCAYCRLAFFYSGKKTQRFCSPKCRGLAMRRS